MTEPWPCRCGCYRAGAQEIAEATYADNIDYVEPCGCWTCDEARRADLPWPAQFMRSMIVCPECGNKRCPRATHHDHACTGSNESGQPGSRYAADVTHVPAGQLQRLPESDEAAHAPALRRLAEEHRETVRVSPFEGVTVVRWADDEPHIIRGTE